MKFIINEYFKNLNSTINNLSIEEIERVAEVIAKAYENEKNIFVCGNGGSASTASHFACDINKGVSYKHNKKFKVISLCDNIPLITAYSNDICYDDIFLEQIKNYFNAGDILICISGSGNSKNIIKVLDYVNSKEGISIGFTGFDGGILKKKAHFSINANINDMQISEDIHMILVHIIMKIFYSKIN